MHRLDHFGGEIAIDLDRRIPVHKALYDALRAAMLTGRLRPGAPFPSSRDLALRVGVARGTVVAVYEQLAGEGYISARRGSGTRVAESLPDGWFDARRSSPFAAASAESERRTPSLSRRGKELAVSPFASTPGRAPRPFRAHVPAVDAFPVEEWGRLVSRRARRDERIFLGGADARGYGPLRAVLADHLRVSRGVVCDADHVVVVPSVQQVIDLAARLVLDPGDEAWVEDPGYNGALPVLEAAGATIVPVRVDAQGIDVAAGVRAAPRARMAYVTPGHQAPLGVTMSIERRLALLDWARERRALVLEDDYDSEYRYEGRPVPALQGLDPAGVVLHAGTFSKTLVPSLRLAYAVVPDRLLDAFVAAKSNLDRFTPALGQAALADFLEGGHFGRHLRRMREIYSERRRALLSALEGELGDAVTVVGARAGLDVAARLEPGWDDRAVERALAEAGIEAFALSRAAWKRRDVNGLLLGFAAFSPARIRKSVGAMASILRASDRPIHGHRGG